MGYGLGTGLRTQDIVQCSELYFGLIGFEFHILHSFNFCLIQMAELECRVCNTVVDNPVAMIQHIYKEEHSYKCKGDREACDSVGADCPFEWGMQVMVNGTLQPSDREELFWFVLWEWGVSISS